jgi:hypothetical protein
MNKTTKMILGAAMVLGAVGTGCGSKTTTVVTGPTIVTKDGYQGYYSGTNFCDWHNNYCGTGVAWGIAPPVIIYYSGYYGYYNNTVFCDWTNNYCGTGLGWGIIDGGTYCDYTYCGGTITWSNGGSSGTTSTGGSTGGTTSGSTGGSTSGSTGGTTSGSTGGSTSGSTGGSTSGSTGGTTGSTGTSGSTGVSGSTGGSTGAVASIGSMTHDVDLQRVQQQHADLMVRAQSVAAQFQMSVTSAVQLTQLSDRMNTLTTNGQQMTDADRAALSEAALNVAGISMDDANAAAANAIKGDKTAVNALIEKAAANLGMSSSATLRTQIMPALGINIGQ